MRLRKTLSILLAISLIIGLSMPAAASILQAEMPERVLSLSDDDGYETIVSSLGEESPEGIVGENLNEIQSFASAGGSTVTAIVTFDGALAAGVNVYLCNAKGSSISSALSNEDGLVTFLNVAQGTGYYFRLYESYDLYPYAAYYGNSLGKTFNVSGNTTGPDIALSSGCTVTATVKLDGVPISDVRVALYNSQGNRLGGSDSDENGIVTFSNQMPGTTAYFYVDDSRAHLEYTGETFTITDGEVGPDVDLSSGNTITTTVKFKGVPVTSADVWVMCYDESGEFWSSVGGLYHPDEQGKITMTAVPSGECYFIVSGTEDYAEYDGHDKGLTFTVPGTVPNIDLDQAYEASTVVKLNGVVQKDVEVLVCLDTPGYYDDVVGQGTTDDDGKVTITGLPGGKPLYFYLYQTSQFLEYDGGQIGKIFTLPGAAPNIELNPGKKITTTATLNGVPQPDTQVKLHRYSSVLGSTYTDENGVATFLVDPADQLTQNTELYFTVSASASYGDYDGNLIGKTFQLSDTPPNIELKAGKSITTKVTLNGVAQPDTRVRLTYITSEGYSTGYRRDVYTDNDGYATFDGIPDWHRCYFTVFREEGSYAAYRGNSKGEYFSVSGTIPNIALEEGITVSTNVTFNGEVQEDVEVYLSTPEGSAYATTNASGIATFTNMLSATDCHFEVDAYGDDVFAHYNGAIKGITFTIPGGNIPNIVLENGHTVTTKVLLRGVAQTGYEVDLMYKHKNDYYYIASQNTDSTGTVTFHNVAAGSKYYFEAFPEIDLPWAISAEPTPTNPGSGSTGSGSVAVPILYNGSERGKIFTVPGIAPIIELDATYGTGNKTTTSGSRGGGGGGGGGGGASPALAVDPTAPAPVTGPVNINDAASMANKALAAAKTAGSKSAAVKFKNVGEFSVEAAKAMIKNVGTAAIKVSADSTLNNGTVDVRLSFNPANVTKTINLSASTRSSRAKATKAIFAKWYSNKIQVVSFAQQGDFGMPVEVVVKLDKELNANTLFFYSFDKATNTYKQIKNLPYWIDKNGYVHFTTTMAGDIIITDKALSLK